MNRPDWLTPELFPFESRYMAIDGNSVHYVDEGTGPAVLFVHGNPDYSLLYRHQIDDLRSDFRCVALDMVGFGLSSARTGFGFTPVEQVDVLRGFVEQLGLTDAVLVVHDWGGPIGLRVAQLLGDRFVGLVIAGSLAWPEYRKLAPWWVRLMMGFLASERGRSLTMKNNFILEGPLRSEMKKGTKPIDAVTANGYRGPFPTSESRLPTWVLAHHLWTRTGDDFLATLEHDMKHLTALPALLISGEADRFTPTEQMNSGFVKHLPHNQTVTIPDAGHFFPESSPQQTTDAIRSWLTSKQA